MSTRWYPIWAKGNPQLRVFLPNFWMKLIKPKEKCPSNIVQFKVSMEMTKYDVKNYLEKIYKIPVINVTTHTFTGDFKKSVKEYLIKEDDYRIAYVTLPKDCEFEFPNLFPEKDKQEKILKEQEEMKQDFNLRQNKKVERQDVPTWFDV